MQAAETWMSWKWVVKDQGGDYKTIDMSKKDVQVTQS